MAFMGLHALIATLLFVYGYGLSLNFTIKPNETSEVTRKNVSIHCSAQELNNVNQIEVMSIAKIGQPTVLANTFILNDKTTIGCFDPSIQCNGKIDHVTPRNSFVEITINEPKVGMSGIYQCSAVFSGLNKKISVTSQHGRLTVSNIDIDHVFGSIKDLQMTVNKEIEIRKSIQQDIATKHMQLGKIIDEMGALKGANKKLISLLHNKGCPNGPWRKFKSNCYKFVKEMKTWFKARDYCRSIGGRLPVIKDSETNKFIFNMTKSTAGTWIGLNDLKKEGDYVWEGSSRPLSYTSWGFSSGKPEPHTYEWDKDAAYMYKNDATWGMWTAKGHSYVICQRKVWTIL